MKTLGMDTPCERCGSTDRNLDLNFHCSTCYANAAQGVLNRDDEIDALKADNARLRALVKAAECNGSGKRCPWCNVWEDEKHYMVPGGNPDYPDCPAFTPDGVVR